jgi:energy-coupling factor transporter ATP-binding protein EcfA2
MSTSRPFPSALLSQPIEARRAYFQDKIVAHPHLQEAHDTLRKAIRYASQGSIILLYGPTGVGKTTLRHGIVKSLMAEAQAQVERDPGYIPVACIEAASTDSRKFDWIDYYTRALIALNEPLVDRKVLFDDQLEYGVEGVHRDGKGRLVIQTRITQRKVRRALENALRYRRPLAFIVDEAAHLQKVSGGRTLRDQMDTLKSLAECTQTVHVMIGTYDLLNLTNLSAQLSRRCRHLHFPRYRLEVAEDITIFKSILQTFQQHLPLPQEPQLVSRWDYFYQYSLGCIGILKDWLAHALGEALEQDQETLTEACLSQHELAADQLISILREIQEGEQLLQHMERERTNLRSFLDLASDEAQQATVTGSVQPAKKPSKPGRRRPSRDPIRGAAHVNV